MKIKLRALFLFLVASMAWSADQFSYLPHYTLRDGLWETRVSLRNTSDATQYLRMTAYDNAGTLVGETGWTIGAGSGTVVPVDELIPNLTADVGWIEFRADGDFFQGTMVFTYLPTGGSSSLPLVTESSRKIVLPLMETNATWQSGFALANTTASHASVTLQLTGFDSEPPMAQTLILPGYAKLVHMLSDVFGDDLPQQASLIITSNEPVVGFALNFASGQSQIVAVPAGAAPEDIETQRTFLTAEDLRGDEHVPGGPVNLKYFAAMGDTAPARHQILGRLTIPETPIDSLNPFDSLKIFPGFSSEFLSDGNDLIPVERDILDSTGDGSYWQIVLSPGKIWYELGDSGQSRGAFPFILTSQYSNRAHYGVATFVYDNALMSNICIQISQENAAWSIYDYWGMLPATYEPGPIADEAQTRALFDQERALQRDIRSFEELNSPMPDAADHFLDGSDPENVSAACVIKDDVIYAQPMMTRHGEFPYPRSMRFGVFSWAKSMAASVAMLRLAQKFGEGVYDLEIADFVTITADHNGWIGVTFADCLNMATGVGEYAPDPYATGFAALADDEGPLMDQFIDAATTQGKLDACFAFGNYDWGPGEVLRYGSFNTFVLSVAMDRYLKAMEGDQARLWDMVANEVYEPIGIFHAPMQHSLDEHGQRDIPIMAWGIFPTVDDVAKVVKLFRDGGAYQGQQLLHPQLTTETLFQTEDIGLPVLDSDNGAGPVTYHFGFWSMAADLGEGPFRIPGMLGYGGNWLMMMPNATCFRIQDDFNMELNGMAEVVLTLPE